LFQFTEGGVAPPAAKQIWVVTDGKAGHRLQCLALAEALGGTVTVHDIAARAPWRFLPPRLWYAAGAAPRTKLTPPWPDLVITAGRSAVAVGAWLGRQGAKTVAVQDPRLPLDWFDAVVAPAHDGLTHSRVIATLGALSRVTPSALDAAEVPPALAGLPSPRVAVLIGGSNARFRFDPATAAAVGATLAALADSGHSLAITASRRTGAAEAAIVRRALDGRPHLWWDGTGANPYLAYLARADHILVTMDSVAMLSDAASTGTPVHGIALPGSPGKFARFHTSLMDAGILRPLTLPLQTWAYPPLQETARAAGVLADRLGW
jgi:hypothetical protein